MTADTPFVRRVNRFIRLSPDEIDYLECLQADRCQVAGRTELVCQGQSRGGAFILLEGWALRYKLLPNGRRQVINFGLPGDFMGLLGVLQPTMPDSVVAFTPAVIIKVPAPRIFEMLHDLPRLGAAILWSASQDEAIVTEHLVDIGRRSALERMAHLFLELHQRLQDLGYASNGSFPCPLTQEVLADALGLSVVHANRVLRQLREYGLLTLSSGRVELHDLTGLKQLAMFDTGYLDQAERQWEVTNGGRS